MIIPLLLLSLIFSLNFNLWCNFTKLYLNWFKTSWRHQQNCTQLVWQVGQAHFILVLFYSLGFFLLCQNCWDLSILLYTPSVAPFITIIITTIILDCYWMCKAVFQMLGLIDIEHLLALSLLDGLTQCWSHCLWCVAQCLFVVSVMFPCALYCIAV